MDIREKLNQNSRLTTAVTAAIVILAVIIVIWQLMPQKKVKDKYTEMFFTTDDGKSYFVDDVRNVPPYTKGGKEAVQAQVVRCGSGKPFVGFLIRYDAEAKAKLEEAKAKGEVPADLARSMDSHIEYRKPGGEEWYKWPSDGWSQASDVKCPDGSRGAMPVFP